MWPAYAFVQLNASGLRGYNPGVPLKKAGPSPSAALVVAIIGVVMAVASMYSVVPRVRLVEAIGLAATSFGAGAALVVAIAERRKRR